MASLLTYQSRVPGHFLANIVFKDRRSGLLFCLASGDIAQPASNVWMEESNLYTNPLSTTHLPCNQQPVRSFIHSPTFCLSSFHYEAVSTWDTSLNKIDKDLCVRGAYSRGVGSNEKPNYIICKRWWKLGGLKNQVGNGRKGKGGTQVVILNHEGVRHDWESTHWPETQKWQM